MVLRSRRKGCREEAAAAGREALLVLERDSSLACESWRVRCLGVAGGLRRIW